MSEEVTLLPALLACLILLHTPDGGEIYIEAAHVVAIRPASQVHMENLAKGSNTVVYTADENFAVTEEEHSVIEKIDACKTR
jgi:hypothetical protein